MDTVFPLVVEHPFARTSFVAVTPTPGHWFGNNGFTELAKTQCVARTHRTACSNHSEDLHFARKPIQRFIETARSHNVSYYNLFARSKTWRKNNIAHAMISVYATLPLCLPITNKIPYADHVFRNLMDDTSALKNETVIAGDSIAGSVKGYVQMKNLAVGGDTTDDFLRRWNTMKRYKPKEIWIHIGLNDLRHGKSVECTFRNIMNIYNDVSSTGVKPVFLNVFDGDVPKKTQLLNKKIKYCFGFIDWTCHILREHYERDNIHPNHKGRAELARGLVSCPRSDVANPDLRRCRHS